MNASISEKLDVVCWMLANGSSMEEDTAIKLTDKGPETIKTNS